MATKKKAKKEILYLHVGASTKAFVKRLAAKQKRRVTLSVMAERILIAAKKNPRVMNAANKGK